MIEGIIAFICLMAFLFFDGNIQILKTCGIFAIASYLYEIKENLKK